MRKSTHQNAPIHQPNPVSWYTCFICRHTNIHRSKQHISIYIYLYTYVQMSILTPKICVYIYTYIMFIHLPNFKRTSSRVPSLRNCSALVFSGVGNSCARRHCANGPPSRSQDFFPPRNMGLSRLFGTPRSCPKFHQPGDSPSHHVSCLLHRLDVFWRGRPGHLLKTVRSETARQHRSFQVFQLSEKRSRIWGTLSNNSSSMIVAWHASRVGIWRFMPHQLHGMKLHMPTLLYDGDENNTLLLLLMLRPGLAQCWPVSDEGPRRVQRPTGGSRRGLPLHGAGRSRPLFLRQCIYPSQSRTKQQNLGHFKTIPGKSSTSRILAATERNCLL